MSQTTVEEVIIIEHTADDYDPDDPQAVTEQKSCQTAPPEQAPSKPTGRKGRKSTYDIPMHVLGHDINKPVEPIVNGRAIPKPRLGVKVPYRNLTSQMISKAEIEQEIMERGRLKLEQNRGDVKLARNLTQRLAKKIAPVADIDKNISNVSDGKANVAEEKKNGAVDQSHSSIQNDSDSLAILEGDEDDPVMTVVQMEPSTNSPQVATAIRTTACLEKHVFHDVIERSNKRKIFNNCPKPTKHFQR